MSIGSLVSRVERSEVFLLLQEYCAKKLGQRSQQRSRKKSQKKLRKKSIRTDQHFENDEDTAAKLQSSSENKGESICSTTSFTDTGLELGFFKKTFSYL